MTATDQILITDPAQLEDFSEVDGIRLTVIGDDGDYLLALGHHDQPGVVAAVFDKFARRLLDEEGLVGWSDFADLDDAADALERRWARFTGTSTGWWCEWMPEPAPGLVPVTVLAS